MYKKSVKQAKGLISFLSEKRITTVVGAWVFYFLLSLVPFMFLLITAFGVFGVNIAEQLIAYLPEEFRLAGETITKTASNVSRGVTVFFAITVITSCSTLLNQMSKDGDFIYGVKTKKKRGFMRRVWAIIALSVLFSVFLGTALLFSFGQRILSIIPFDGNLKYFVTIGTFSLVILISYVIIILLNKFICPINLRLGILMTGSIVSLAIIVIGTIGFTIYLRFFNNYNAFYGSLATVIVFLLWAYILMLGLVLGTILNAKLILKDRENVKDLQLHKKLRKRYQSS